MSFMYPMQANFSRGEASPRLTDRVDTEFYKAMLKTCTNWTVLKQGGLRRRPAFLYVKEVKDSSKKVRLIPFNFGTPSNGIPQAYVLEMGNLYFRPYTTGGIITTVGGTPTAATIANPGVFTQAGHGLVNGDKVFAVGFAGDFAQLNNREFTVAGVAGNNYNIGVNTTGFAAYVAAAGTIKKIVEVVTTYAEADLKLLDYAQSADKLTVTHLSYQSKDITRTSDTAWTTSNVTFMDGPYLDEPITNVNGFTADITGSYVPKMTSNILPAGTVVRSDAAATAWQAFDQDPSTSGTQITNPSGWWEYTGAASGVVNSYSVRCDSELTSKAPAAWDFQGWNGAAWVTLDSRQNQTSWGGGEIRYFDFINNTAFSKYRILISGTGGSGNIALSEMGWGYNGDYAPTMTLTFDSTTDINDGTGFDVGDIGRNIRLRAADGKWRWFLIVGVTSTTIVTGRMYGFALPNLSKIYRWKLGSFRSGSWPSKVGYYQQRRVFARSIKQPYTTWLSQTFGFTSFGTSSPLLDDDAIAVSALTGKVNGVAWLDDGGDNLAIGTTNNVRLVDKANRNLGFGATNFDHNTKSAVGSKEVKPVRIGDALLYCDYFGKTLREFLYDLNTDGYPSPDVTILSDHLLSAGIAEMAYQQTPDSNVWIVTETGGLVCMTYQRDQKIVALTNCPVAPGDVGTLAIVESVCSIPGTTRDEVFISVKRTIGGVTKRFIEKLAPEFEYLALVDAAVGVDSALQYSGAATNVVYGAWHLIGQVVNVLADGVVFRAITVSAIGTITLPLAATASKWTIGLPYTSLGETLELAQLSYDGSHLGRRKLTGELYVSTMNSLGLTLKGMSAIEAVNLWERDNVLDPASGAMTLRTGRYPTRFDQSWKDGGQFQFYVSDPLPCTIRGFTIGAQGEP